MRSTRASLYIALCLMTWHIPAYAQNATPGAAPMPERPTPRVPFTAFRMKPILQPRLQAEQAADQAAQKTEEASSLVIPDDEKPAPVQKTAPKPQAPVQPAVQAVQQEQPAHTLGVLPVIRSKPTPPAQAPQPAPAIVREQERQTIPASQVATAVSDYISPISGLPIPPRKPGNTDGRSLIDSILAQPSTSDIVQPIQTARIPQDLPPLQEQDITAPALPPEVELQQQVEQPEPAPADPSYFPPIRPETSPSTTSSVRIRDKGRFSSDQRTAGLRIGSADSKQSADLPDELRNIRIGRLEEAEGISPIIIPGLQQAAIPRAPGQEKSAQQKLPSEVIVFFQENSDELEVGQLEVLKSDVVQLLKERSDLDVEVVGYAEQGDAAKRLSQARALMIRDYLVRQKIDGGRVEVTARANDTKIEPRDRADLFFSR